MKKSVFQRAAALLLALVTVLTPVSRCSRLMETEWIKFH